MGEAYKPINIYCSSCGAPAKFDIAKQTYLCSHCGANTGIDEALEEKRGFRMIHRESMERGQGNFPTVTCSCDGCGATVVFPENEALTNCAFCGRSLSRGEYLKIEDFPEVLIPFRITEEEARTRLLDWCSKNSRRREARDVKNHADELKGFYLPYELVKGPVNCSIDREATLRKYNCRGFLEGSFINTSSNLDNLVLDGTEPYDTNELREFGFSYLAGQRVKIRDLNSEETLARVRDEIASDYEPYISKVMETRAVTIKPDTGGMMRLSAVLPAYYLRAGQTLAAVNGQTGKVAVREIKERYMLPWQLRPLGWTVAISALIFAVMTLFRAEMFARLYVSGIMAVFLLIVLFAAYHNEYGGSGRRKLPKRIFTSGEGRPHVSPPEFYENFKGGTHPAKIRFTTPARVIKTLILSFGTIFLPLIIAFILNGFSIKGLTVGGAAVWLCITVPIVPVYYLKFGRLDLYERPIITVRTPEGRKKRVRPERKSLKERMSAIKDLSFSTIFIIAAVLLGILIINTALVLHWDSF